MKKLLLFVILAFTLMGCSKYSLNEEFKADLSQVLEKVDTAYEENREMNEKELNLFNQFEEKYEVGKFIDKNDKEYEMNDLEKAITYKALTLKWLTVAEETLSSEENAYDMTRSEIDKYIEDKNIPEHLKGEYPTYEIYSGIHPKVAKDVKEIINSFDEIVNDEEVTSVQPDEITMLDDFVNKYDENEFEVDGKSYLMNDKSSDVLFMVKSMKEEISSGKLSIWTMESFNEVKEKIEE